MKNIICYILLATTLVTSTSCSDFLQEVANSEVSKNEYMLNASESEVVLLGVYRNMVTQPMYGYHLSILFTMGTDISQVEGSTNENFRIIPTNSFSANQREVQATWQMLYNSIYNANDFIEAITDKMQAYSDYDKKLANVYIGEARALRALYYFELLRRFGNIPLITNTAQSALPPSEFVQADPVDVYKFIEADLLASIEALPYAVDDDLRKENDFRLSKGAALGLLAKVYATWAGYPVRDEAKWQSAAETAEILIKSGKHALLDDYEQLWKNSGAGVWNPTESLIEVSFYNPTASMGSDPIGRIGKWNGVKASAIPGSRPSNAGNLKVVHTFVLDWRSDTLDLRRDISIANYRYNPSKMLWVQKSSDTDEIAEQKDSDITNVQKEKQNYTPAKWDTEKYVPQSNALINNDKSNVNWYILRYSDVLLLYAEAINEWKGAPDAEAYAAINLVRARGYGMLNNESDLPVGLSNEEFRQVVRKERAYELAFEGHRRLDLVRWGIYYETVQETAQALNDWWGETSGSPNYAVATPGYTTKGKHELFPIPQRELDLTNFKPNPLWE